MKVQSTQQQIHPQFKGPIDTTMRFLATNQAIGANGVDVCFMVTPRTASDMIKRGPAAGMETLRREIMGTVNDTFMGLFGAGAGALIAWSLDKKYGLKVNKFFTAPETLNILAENKAQQIKDNKSQIDYIKQTLGNVKAYNPDAAGRDAEEFVRISKETIDEVAKSLDNTLNKKVKFNEWIKKDANESRQYIINKITSSTGAQSEYILESAIDKKNVSKTNLKSLLNDMYLISDSFNNEKVKAAFQEQIKAGKTIKDNQFIKGLSKFMKTRSAMGFAIASIIGLSVQPINMYLSKLKTGTDGFVGVEGRSKDNSNGFKAIKAASSVGFFSMILATLGMNPLTFVKSPAKFMDKMSFTGKMPTINQLKGVYGITIISRIFSARDKDELREVLTKDTLGYLSWLVLGDIINKLAADGLDKTVINYKDKFTPKNSQGFIGTFKRTFNGSLKTRDEILVKTLADNGIDVTKKDGDKIVSKKFGEMLKDLKKLDKKTQKLTRKRLRTLNIAQGAGYLFSGLVLGLGIPNLNIYVTNKLDKKRKAAKEKQQKEIQISTAA